MRPSPQLANTIMTPMWGRVSDIVGRKAVLFPGIVVFAIGSALCGASQSMNMLIGGWGARWPSVVC